MSDSNNESALFCEKLGDPSNVDIEIDQACEKKLKDIASLTKVNQSENIDQVDTYKDQTVKSPL